MSVVVWVDLSVRGATCQVKLSGQIQAKSLAASLLAYNSGSGGIQCGKLASLPCKFFAEVAEYSSSSPGRASNQSKLTLFFNKRSKSK